MKKVAVFFQDKNPLGYPLNIPEYFTSYMQLSDELNKLGAEFYIVRSQDSYLGNGIFSNSWSFEGGNLSEFGKVKIDCIYDKGDQIGFISDGIPVLNNSELTEICSNKWKTYQLFEQFSPKTLFIENKEQLLSGFADINTEIFVVKPINMAGGKNVYIGKPGELLKQKTVYPVLLQEFIDSSVGIKGLVDGYHDLRVALLNGEVLFSYLRTPKEGKLAANIAQGGGRIMVKKEEIPQEALELAKKIDKQLERFKTRLFSVDMAFTKNGPKLIELESRIGLTNNDVDPVFKVFKKRLAETLVSLC